MYSKAHAAIRADPTQKAKVEKTVEKKRWNRARLSAAQRNLSQTFFILCFKCIFQNSFWNSKTERIASPRSKPLSSVPNKPRNKSGLLYNPCFIISVRLLYSTGYKNVGYSEPLLGPIFTLGSVSIEPLFSEAIRRNLYITTRVYEWFHSLVIRALLDRLDELLAQVRVRPNPAFIHHLSQNFWLKGLVCVSTKLLKPSAHVNQK